MNKLTNILTYTLIVTFITFMVAFGIGNPGTLMAQDEETTETTATETTAEDTSVQGDLMNFRMIIWNSAFALHIQPGETVTWVNTDASLHKIVSGTQDEPTSLFESPDLDTADTFDFTFEEEGVFYYYLEDIPLVRGTIVVGSPEMPATTEETAAGETTAETTAAETTAEGETTAETTAAGETTAAETTAAGETTAETTAAQQGDEGSPMETVQITGDYAIAIYTDQFGLSVPEGSTVVFENMDSTAWTIMSGTAPEGDGVFDSGELMQGDTFEYTFDQAGVMRFFLQGMVESRGMILVGDLAEVSAPGATFEEDTAATTTDTAATETTEAETAETETTS